MLGFFIMAVPVVVTVATTSDGTIRRAQPRWPRGRRLDNGPDVTFECEIPLYQQNDPARARPFHLLVRVRTCRQGFQDAIAFFDEIAIGAGFSPSQYSPVLFLL